MSLEILCKQFGEVALVTFPSTAFQSTGFPLEADLSPNFAVKARGNHKLKADIRSVLQAMLSVVLMSFFYEELLSPYLFDFYLSL